MHLPALVQAVEVTHPRMEVGEGSSIARELGRSWTTHTGAAGGSSVAAAKQKKQKNKQSNKPAWASLEVQQQAALALSRYVCSLPLSASEQW